MHPPPLAPDALAPLFHGPDASAACEVGALLGAAARAAEPTASR